MVVASGALAPDSVRASNLYWDTNGTAPDSGAATGIWGVDAFWNTDATGGSGGSFQIGTTILDDVYFSAGTSAIGGVVRTTGAAQSVNGITFEENAPISILATSNLASLTLGTGGITVLAGNSSASTVATALLVNSPNSFTNNGTGLLTVSGATVLGSGAGLTINGSGATTISGLISGTVPAGTVALTIGGTATVTLANAGNTFSGDIAINGTGATLVYTGTTTTTASQLGRGPGTAYKQVFLDNGGAFRVNSQDFNDNIPTAVNTAAGVIFNIGAGGGVFDVTTGRNLTIDDGSGTGTGLTAAQLQGTGTLTKTGAGTLSLGTGTSNFGGFTGAIVVADGVLQTGAVSTNPFGSTAVGTTVLSGASLNVGAVNIGAEPLTLSGGGFAGRGALYATAAGGSVTGPITLAADTTFGAITVATSGLSVSGVVSGNFNLNKVGVGSVGFNQANTVQGTLTAGEGNLNINGALGSFQNITGVVVTGSAALNIGDGTAANGLADRINTSAGLTLGGANGGGNLVALRGSTVASSQSFTTLSVGAGISSITNSGTTGGAPVFTFTSANPYTRSVGGILNVTNTNVTTSFTNAPSGAGNVVGITTPILVGGIVNGNDFAAAAAGSVSATTYTTDAWASGNNTQVTSSTAPASDSTTQSLAFGAGTNTVTLAGTNTIQSGGILVQTAATGGTITGGSLQGPAGKDLWVFLNSKPLTIASSIVDNGGSSLTVGGTGVAASILTLTGSNTYTGTTLVNNLSTLTLSNPSANNTTIIGDLAIGSHSAATVSFGASNQIADTSAVTFNSGTLSGQSAILNLNGFSETVGSIATTANPLGTASVIQNGAAAGTSILTVAGNGTTVYDGIIRNGAAGTLGLTLAGSTNLTLTNQGAVAGTNYTGPTTIGAGATLNMYDGNGSTIATFASAITNNGTLTLNNVNLLNSVVAQNRTLAPAVSGSGAVNVNANVSSITFGGALSYTGTTTIGSGTMIVSSASAGTLTGQITGSGNFSQTGAGALTVSNATNNYAGTTNITTGALNFQNHSLPSTSPVTIGAAGTLGIFDNGAGSGGVVAYGNNIAITGATSTINVNANGANTGNTIAFGTLTLPAATNVNTFTGANSYKVSFTNLVLPGTTGATSTLSPTTTSVAVLGDVTNAMSNYGTTNFDTLILDGTSTGNSISGNISDAVGGSFVSPLLGGYTRLFKQNSSTWTISGANNSYSGITQVLGGTLIAGASNLIPLTNVQGVNITAAATLTATLDLGGFDQTLNTAGGTGTAVLLGGSAATGTPSIIGSGSTLTINGNVTYANANNPLGGSIAVSTLNLGGGNRTFNVGDSTTAAIDLTVTSLVQNGSITKTGLGLLQLTQATAVPIVFNAGGLDLGGNAANVTLAGGSLVQNGTVITNTVTKQGPGTLTFASTSATSGVTAVSVSQGLGLTTSNPATPSAISVSFGSVGATNFFQNTATLSLGGSATSLAGGGSLQMTGFAAGTNSQTFASTLIDAGANSIGATIGAGGSVALNLGPITRNVGGTVDFTVPAGGSTATNGIIAGGTPTAGTLVTGPTGAAFATVGGNDWAANSSANPNYIVAANVAGVAGASIYNTANSAATFLNNADITGAFTATSGSTVNSLRFNTGALTLTLAGTNTITSGGILIGNGTSGVTTITGGNIRPGAGVGELALIINKPNTQAIFSSIIQDNGGTPTVLTFRGNANGGTTGGILGLTANNLYTGGTYVTSGRLQVVSGTATTPFGTGPVYVNGNTDGQVFISTNTNIANPFVIVGNGFNENGTRLGALRLNSTAALIPQLSGPITLLGDTQITNSAAITGAGAAIISNNIGTSNSAGATSFTLSKTGTGVIKLSGTNSQTNTLISAGALNVNADAALGITGAPITFNGGTLQYQNSFAIATARPVVLTGAGSFDTGLLGTTSTTLSNVISGAGALTKVYSTPGVNSAPLILTGDNTFTGAVNVNSGWLTVTSSTSLGVGSKTISMTAGSAGDVQLHLDPSLGNTPGVGIDLPATMPMSISNTLTLTSGAIANDSGNNTIRGAITITSGGGGGTIISNAGNLTLTGTIAALSTQVGRDLHFRGNGTGIASGIISDGGTFQLPVFKEAGTGTWTFSGANTYAGATTISTGTLKVGNANALGFGGVTTAAQATFAGSSNQGTTVAAGATLDLSGITGVNEVITLNGTGVGGSGALINSVVGTPASLSGNLASASVSAPGNTAAATAVTIAGGGGTGAVATANLGVTSATFAVTSGTQTYSVAPTVAITGGGGAGATATANLTGGLVTSITITNAGTSFATAPTLAFSAGTISAAGTPPTATGNATAFQVNSVSVTNAGTGYTSAPTFTLGNATITPIMSAVVLGSNSSVGGAGDITIGGAISGAFNLAKVGSGKLTLGGAGSYNGGLDVNEGYVIANTVSAPGTGTTTVGPLGTFIAGAAHTNPITLSGGTFGTKVALTYTGTLTATAATTSIVTFSDPLNTASENDINVSGTLAGSGNINVLAGTNNAVATDAGTGFRFIGTGASTYSGVITVGNEAKFEARTTVPGPFSPIGTGKVVLTGGTFGPALAGTYSSTIFRNNSAGNTTFGNDVEITGTGLAVINSPSSAPVGSVTTLGNLKIGGGQILGPNRNAGNAQVLAFTSVTLTGGNATFAPNTFGAGYSGSVDLTLGAIGESASSGIIMDGQATLRLVGANNYSGPTTIQRGTTLLGAAGALPSTTALTVTGGILNLNNGGTSNNQTVASLAGTGGTITNSDAVQRTLSVNQATVSTEYSGAITGALALTKQGNGTLTLSGTQNYAALNANGGTTNLTSTFANSTAAISATAALNIGVSETFGSLNIGDGGVVTLGAIAPAAPEAAPQFVLDGFGGDAVIGGDSLAPSAPIQGVPEPGTATLLFGGLLTMLGVRRRR